MQNKDQGNQAELITKRELLVALTALVEDWNGSDAIDRQHARKFSHLVDDLERSYLFPSERHILRACDQWMAEARRKPYAGLREQWLHAMKDWLSCFNENMDASGKSGTDYV